MKKMSSEASNRPPLPSREGVVAVVGAAIISGSRCLVARRKPGGSAGGKWEFPGGKVELGETPEGALQREIQEELGCTICVAEWVGRGTSKPDERFIVLDVYRCAHLGPEIEAPGHAHDAILWARASDLSGLDWAEADVPIVLEVEALLSTAQNIDSWRKTHGK